MLIYLMTILNSNSAHGSRWVGPLPVITEASDLCGQRGRGNEGEVA